jgi:predicted HTH transcriptional regulator
MAYRIDLKELAQRESEQVEWKENGDDKDVMSSIVKTISAFANDISNFGGGYVICGAKEIKDAHGFPAVKYTGLTANKLKEIEGKVTQHCRDYISPSVVPIVQELENPEDASTRILVFIIPASYEAHTYRDGNSTNYYVRISRETREARNGVFTQLMIKKQKIEYFDKRVNNKASEADLDLLLFRDSMHQMRLLVPEKSLEDYLSEKDQIHALIPPLFAKTPLDSSLHPKNFTVLLFGKEQSITRFYTGAYSILSIYNGIDRSEPTAERHTFTGSVIIQSKKVIDLLNSQAYTVFDKTNRKPNQVKYPIRALQEAVVNAIVHRDYEIPEPIRITVFIDRIEIKSPGTLHWGVDKAKFLKGKASAKWRNQSFAEVFNRLQLAQSEGQGIPSIFRTMKEEGCPDPIFEIEEDSITCILPAHPRHQILRAQQKSIRRNQ